VITSSSPSGSSRSPSTCHVRGVRGHVGAPIDANGNLTSDGTRTFEWDARNQLVSVAVGIHRSEFSYDGLQYRVRTAEKENGIIQADQRTIWCETSICEDRKSDGVTVARRLFEHGAQQNASDVFTIADHLGSVTETLDTSGTMLGRHAYDPWGRRILVSGTDVGDVGFTGYMWHAVSSSWFATYRGYNPAVGRWLRADPIGLRGGPNLYSYALGNPVVNWDPLGLDVVKKPPFIGDHRPPGGPPAKVAPWRPGPSTGPRAPRMTPKRVLRGGGRIGAGGAAAGVVIWSVSCVILELYCASQRQQGYNACMQAADPEQNCFCIK
jgi:RHS repeat-associated protein